MWWIKFSSLDEFKWKIVFVSTFNFRITVSYLLTRRLVQRTNVSHKSKLDSYSIPSTHHAAEWSTAGEVRNNENETHQCYFLRRCYTDRTRSASIRRPAPKVCRRRRGKTDQNFRSEMNNELQKFRRCSCKELERYNNNKSTFAKKNRILWRRISS